MTTSPWLDGKPAPDVTRLADKELLDVWVSNRNNLLGHVAADEFCKRAYAQRQLKETT
jgi:hypothetical protein